MADRQQGVWATVRRQGAVLAGANGVISSSDNGDGIFWL